MKSLIQAALIAAVVSVPAVSFAQSADNTPITRAQVKADLIQFEQASPRANASVDPYYPADAQAAEARIASRNGETSGYGGAVTSASASGNRVQAARTSANNFNDVYFGR